MNTLEAYQLPVSTCPHGVTLAAWPVGGCHRLCVLPVCSSYSCCSSTERGRRSGRPRHPSQSRGLLGRSQWEHSLTRPPVMNKEYNDKESLGKCLQMYANQSLVCCLFLFMQQSRKWKENLELKMFTWIKNFNSKMWHFKHPVTLDFIFWISH